MRMSDFQSHKFKRDINFKWKNEYEHCDCLVVRYTENLDQVSKIILAEEAQSYHVCEVHKVFRKTPFDQLGSDVMILDSIWEKLDEEDAKNDSGEGY